MMEIENNTYENLKAEINKLKSDNELLRKELKDKKYLLEIFTENMFDKIVLCDMEGNYKYLANSKRLLGFDEDELKGRNALSFIHKDDLPHIQASFIDFVAKSDGLIKEEYRHLKADGTYSWLETLGKILKDDSGNNKEILFCSRDISERVKYQNELRKSETQYRLILDNAHESIFILQAGKFVYFNPVTNLVSGYSKEDFFEINFIEFIHPDDRQRVMANYQKRLAGEKVDSKHEYRILSKSGKLLWLELQAAETLWNNLPATIYFANDITERKLAEAALRASEDKFHALLNSMKEFVFIKDEKLRYIFANQSMQDFHGLSKDRILGKTDYNLMPDEAAKQCEFSDRMALSSRSNYISEETINGRIYETHKYLIPIKDEVFGVGGYIADITEKRNAEIALRESEEKLRKIQNSALDAIIMINEFGNIELWNPAAEKIFGYSSDEIIGKNAHELLMPDRYAEKQMKGWKCYRETGQGKVISEPYESYAIKKDGTEIPVEIGIASVIIKEQFWAVAYIRDITERKKYLEALLKSDKLISAFLLNISHEIRTPMNGIMGFMNLLSDFEFSCDEREEFYHEFKKSGNRLMNTIDDLLEISRVETNQFEMNADEFDVLELLSSIFNESYFNAENKGLEFKFTNNTGSKLNRIHSDRSKIKKIVNILIHNAIKFTNKGFVELGCQYTSEKLEIFVRDSGVGIAKENLEVIFDRFVQAESELTRDYEGNGLGLSIVKSYCKVLNAKVWAESELGKGSTFIVSLAR